jgi:hypothetical protein
VSSSPIRSPTIRHAIPFPKTLPRNAPPTIRSPTIRHAIPFPKTLPRNASPRHPSPKAPPQKHFDSRFPRASIPDSLFLSRFRIPFSDPRHHATSSRHVIASDPRVIRIPKLVAQRHVIASDPRVIPVPRLVAPFFFKKKKKKARIQPRRVPTSRPSKLNPAFQAHFWSTSALPPTSTFSSSTPLSIIFTTWLV